MKTTQYNLHTGDCRDVMRGMDAESIDSIVCDPPYGLSMMGKAWDHGVPSVEFWLEALRVAKPGAHLLAFGGTRTFHRLTCAIEDAGWEIRDCVMWVYGSGFPKSLNVSKAIDNRRAGNDLIRPWLESLGTREELARVAQVTPRQIDHYLGNNKTPCPQTLPFERFVLLCEHFDCVPDWVDAMYPKCGRIIGTMRHSRSGGNDFAKRPCSESRLRECDITAPATEAAKQWEGWGTALKPAWEPIIMARKPLVGTVAANVLTHGTGAINVDGCRVGTETRTYKGSGAQPHKLNAHEKGDTGIGYMDGSGRSLEFTAVGRFPANLIHDGSDLVLAEFPQTASGAVAKGTIRGKVSNHNVAYADMAAGSELTGYGDSGSAARFFYCAKASKQDRDEGLDALPVAGVSQQYGLKTSVDEREGRSQGERTNSERRNNHPTVKPTALMRYLCKLVTPPNGIVLDPFMGSGSTGKAAILEGFRFVGIDITEEYVAIATARIEAAAKGCSPPPLWSGRL